MRRAAAAALGLCILGGFGACGKPPAICEADNLTKNPQLCPDRDSLGFAQEFHSGTFLGTRAYETLLMRNGGTSDLVITSVTISGDSSFKYTGDWTDANGLPPTVTGSGNLAGTTLKGNKTALLQVEFTPTSAKQYSATLTVVSNAENSPNKIFSVSGCGVPTSGELPACYCTPETDADFCTRLGKTCGTVSALDNCNRARTVTSCGTCAAPKTCLTSPDAGAPNTCG